MLDKLAHFIEALVAFFLSLFGDMLTAISAVGIVLIAVQVLLVLGAMYWRGRRKTITKKQILIYLLAFVLLCCMTLGIYELFIKEVA